VESPGPAARTSFTDKPDPDHGRRSHITLSAKGRKLTGYAHCRLRSSRLMGLAQQKSISSSV
jgi:hypothetical protein